jgi:hypothetical protein
VLVIVVIAPFSKKLENHAATVALYFMYYNFGRAHQTLRVTPAMEAGIADHVWSIEEIVGLLGLTTSASPGRLDSTVRVRAARRNPGRSRATRSARAFAGAPTGAGAAIGPADPAAGSRASRLLETDSRSATGAATPHLVDRVSACLTFPTSWRYSQKRSSKKQRRGKDGYGELHRERS